MFFPRPCRTATAGKGGRCEPIVGAVIYKRLTGGTICIALPPPPPPPIRQFQAIDVPHAEEIRRPDACSGKDFEPGKNAANTTRERFPRNFCHGE